MKAIQRDILRQIVDGTAEPVVVANVAGGDWPIAFANPSFLAQAGQSSLDRRPFADVLETMFGRTLALEISEAVRARSESTIPVEVGRREFLLVLKPLQSPGRDDANFCAAYLRSAEAATAAGADVQQELSNARRRIRDLSREDPVTGLLNARAFREVLDHDWSVARREKSSLALVAFKLDEFDRYFDVFGRHAADSCQRRVASSIRRYLKRASDVAARIEGEGGDRLVVLSHSADEALVRDFASRIAKSVRELGLHHPRSSAGRFVTVSFDVAVSDVAADKLNAADFLQRILG